MQNKRGRDSYEVLPCFSQRPSQKKGGVADLVSLTTATVIIVIILILFIAFAGIVKVFEKVENGEKIYKEGEVGVGDLNHYMLNYNRLINVTKRVRSGEVVSDALRIEDYGKAPVVDEFMDIMVAGVWGVFYG